MRHFPRLGGPDAALVLEFDGPPLSAAEVARQRRRREIYGATQPRDGLGPFDAAAMDILEGRR